MANTTERLAFPLLAAAQAQKEVTHNEALALADIAVQAVVQSVGLNAPPAGPVNGQCWIVGGSPSGVWTGQAGAIAGWTTGGWRFVAPFEGQQAWSTADTTVARRSAGTWVIGSLTGSKLSINGQQVVASRQARVVPPAGGTTIDAQARAAIAAVIAGLEAHGLFSST